tara:strand:- start:287 stop:625 length:339 start_codon:yes stop_codon:yes gene_type:complete
MSKILQGRLPLASPYTNQFLDVNTFNKFVRILELSLDAVDFDATPQYTDEEIDQLQFPTGEVIWNLTQEVLQVWLGTRWEYLSTPSTSGLSATATLGTVQVIASGNITVEIS